MATEVTLPALGESVTEGTVTQWLKAVGDEVAVDEPLLEVSTDKVDTEGPSPIAGTPLAIRVGADGTRTRRWGSVPCSLSSARPGPARVEAPARNRRRSPSESRSLSRGQRPSRKRSPRPSRSHSLRPSRSRPKPLPRLP